MTAQEFKGGGRLTHCGEDTAPPKAQAAAPLHPPFPKQHLTDQFTDKSQRKGLLPRKGLDCISFSLPES